MTFPVLSALIALPALGALVVRSLDADAARRVAAGCAALATIAAVALAITLHPSATPAWVELSEAAPLIGARWHLGLDGVSALLGALACLVATAVLVAAPRAELDRGAIVSTLLTLSATLGIYFSLDLALLTAFWIASLVPGAIQMRRARSGEVRVRLARTYDAFLLLGALPIVAVTVLVGWSRTNAGLALPFDLGGGPVPDSVQHVVFVLLALAILIRAAIVPFHSWLPVLIERGPIGIAALVTGTHLGAFLAARVAMPLVPHACASDLPILGDVALVSSLYAAFVALSQVDLRRALGFVLTSQMGLVLVGLSGMSIESVQGALLQMLALGVSAVGLLLVATGIEARLGTTDTRRLGGLVLRFPKMAAAFLLLGLAAVGAPGSLQYVAEDLLLHGLLDGHPVVASALLLATVLNGVTLLRLFVATFYGPSREAGLVGPGVRDLLPRELAVATALVVLVLAAGLAPGAFVREQEPTVLSIATAHGHGG